MEESGGITPGYVVSRLMPSGIYTVRYTYQDLLEHWKLHHVEREFTGIRDVGGFLTRIPRVVLLREPQYSGLTSDEIIALEDVRDAMIEGVTLEGAIRLSFEKELKAWHHHNTVRGRRLMVGVLGLVLLLSYSLYYLSNGNAAKKATPSPVHSLEDSIPLKVKD